MAGNLSNIKLSTVVPAKVTAGDTVHGLKNTDLALKLHYLKGVYFFDKDAAQGLTISQLKSAMFPLLDLYYPVAGRIRRRPEDGRPFIKCNDGGVRIVEAEADVTVDEWVERKMDIFYQLAYADHVIGPDLAFSPLVFLQFTWFICGGFSVGLSWAHVLGDAFSASHFINLWGQILKNQMPPITPFSLQKSDRKFQFPISIPKKLSSMKRVDHVGDLWSSQSANASKLVTFSLLISSKQLDQIKSKTNSKTFQSLVAIIWKSLAKVKGEFESKIVTICTSDFQEKKVKVLTNGQTVSIVEVDFTVSKANISDLTEVITKKAIDESGLIEEQVEGENQKDYILYGANLTFVNLEGADIYGLELKGRKPILANYTMTGIGDDGVVLILPSPENHNGRLVTMILPNAQVVGLKNELKIEWGLY